MEKPIKTKRKKHIALWIILGVLAVAIALGAFYVHKILTRPQDMFSETVVTPVPEASALSPAFPIPADGSESGTTPVPTATPEPVNVEDTDPHGILNIMLMGVDAFEDGKTTSGTMPHTDVIMVIAINFDNDTVDLISLPRDTMTTAPGHFGYYKLNGVFNVGIDGKYKTTGASGDMTSGFALTCRAAEIWLGGISIPYYYALDFQAVIDIVDAIGGIDYDLDIPITSSYAFGTRSYSPGMQHLDGVAVMGYLRTRYGVTHALDSARTERQRRMMVAIFNKLKTEGKLSQVPALISAANSGIYTNTTLAQTVSLANYANKLDSDRIRTRSMFGEIGTIEFDWRYVYVDQQNRIDLIKEVYGIDATPIGTCTRQYERWLHRIGFVTMKRLRQMEKVLTRAQELKDSGRVFTDEEIALYTDCYTAYRAMYDAFDAYTEELADVYATTAWREKPKETSSKWTEEQRTLDNQLTAREDETRQSLIHLADDARRAVNDLASAIGYRGISWSISGNWYQDSDVNEVIVNFG